MKSGYFIPKLSALTILSSMLLVWIMAGAAFSQGHRIWVDGDVSDWQIVKPLYTDPINDQVSGTLDFHRLWVTHDEKFLFLRIEVGAEINMQDQNSLVMYLDTDDDATTGKSIYGLGAELEWRFGERAGRFYSGKNQIDITHSKVGIVTAPTVSASDFEIALSRQAQPVAGTPLFAANRIRIAFEDRGPGKDRLPDTDADVSFDFTSTDSLEKLPPLSPGRQHPEHLRFLSYNVLRDRLFDGQALAYYQRILRAIQPDVIGFQEIYTHDARQTVELMEKILPLADNRRWHGAKVGRDLVVISKFPIVQSYQIPGSNLTRANAAFLLDLRPAWSSQLLFVNAHPPCCSDNSGRQYEIDAIMAFIRNAQTGAGEQQLPRRTPILIVGDMNLVGYAQQLHTLLSGEIKNQRQFGVSFRPDWDGTDLADLRPRQLQSPMFFTWYEASSSYSPGRLDFMIYSDSVLEPGNRFVLFTPDLNPDTLRKYQLQAHDAILASDHLPVVGDFFLNLSDQARTEGIAPDRFLLDQNYPNPFAQSTTIRYEIQTPTHVQLIIVNALGQEVRQLVDSTQTMGSYVTTWDGKDNQGRSASPGIYFCVLKARAHTLVKKLLYLR